MKRTDILIVGGGVIGSAVAWWLKGAKGSDARVTVLEPDVTYERGSTGRSLGSIRQQFSTPENILISRFGIDFIRRSGEILEVDGERPDVQFRPGHYLFLATGRGAETLAENVRVQRETGADITLMTPAELSERLPWIRNDDIAAAAIGERDEGWLDPYALLRAFRAAAIRAGVVYLQDRAVGLVREVNRIVGVELADGGKLAAGHVVNAAGPWAGDLAATADIDLPVRPRKRTVFRVTTPEPPQDPVLIVDPSGVYVRPEGDGFLAGSSPLAGDTDPDTFDLDPVYTQFDDICWPALAHRVPAFERLKMAGAWAGLYAVNTFDHNAVLGPHPEIGNLYFANGFTGHGLQQSPAVGRALAEWILDGASTSLNLDRFRFDRIAANRPIVERGVI
ncbi:MAG: NAD(P)/FAD-dependent oxidoreductase [Minwuia sp.]|uniref:NAD(P)/FAD-dependent oxidoreductase n=1 Tax=Minwuia sp. TaxID=2493630 RepID=UPI003A88576E